MSLDLQLAEDKNKTETGVVDDPACVLIEDGELFTGYIGVPTEGDKDNHSGFYRFKGDVLRVSCEIFDPPDDQCGFQICRDVFYQDRGIISGVSKFWRNNVIKRIVGD